MPVRYRMTWGQYRRTTLNQLKGRKVRVNRELRNGMMVIPEGAIATIDDKHGGFSLTSDPCPHCGVRISISKVPPQDIDLLPENHPLLRNNDRKEPT